MPYISFANLVPLLTIKQKLYFNRIMSDFPLTDRPQSHSKLKADPEGASLLYPGQ